jgi:hypothetical protein
MEFNNFNQTEIDKKIYDLLVDGHDIWESPDGLRWVSKHGSTLVLITTGETMHSDTNRYFILTEKLISKNILHWNAVRHDKFNQF